MSEPFIAEYHISFNEQQVQEYNQNHDADGKFGGGSNGGSSSGGHGHEQPITDVGQKEKALKAPTTKWEKSLTPEERAAISEYAGGGYSVMNSALRTGKYVSYQRDAITDPAIIDPQIANARSGLMKGQSPATILVNRGADRSLLAQFQSGGTFTDAGFTSTTINDQANFGAIKLHVTIPKGSPGAYIRNVAPEFMQRENEFLLPPGGKFRIDKNYTDARGKNHVDMTYLGVGGTTENSFILSLEESMSEDKYSWNIADIVFAGYPQESAINNSSWQNDDEKIQQQLQQYQDEGVTHLEWLTYPDACDACQENNGQICELGTPFRTGAMMPTQHPECTCRVRVIKGGQV